MSSEETSDTEGLEPPPRRRWRLPHWAGAVFGALAALAVAAGLVVRLAPLTPAGRAFIVAHAGGLPVGPLGRLRLGGLSGDIWSDFTLDRLSIEDAQGPWLAARHIHVRWRPTRLLRRRIHAQLVQADQLTLIRRPLVTQGRPGGRSGALLPVSIFVDRLDLKVETLPAFSVERGLSQIVADLDIARSGGVAGGVVSRNLLRPGDGIEARFDLGVGRKVLLDGHAHESRGGALAGVLGLPVARALNIDAKAGGDVVQGSSRFLAYSGDTPIGQAAGEWSKAGGGVQGWVSLAASTWTAPLQHALGPQLDFAFQHAEVKGAERDVVLKLFSDNAALSLAGRLDLDHHRAPEGLKADLTVKDLSRWVAQPVMGPGRFDGVLKGELLDGQLTGEASVGRLSWDGYALAGAGGPLRLTWHKQEVGLTLTAQGVGGQGVGGQGVGGQGGGLLAGLAGARPSASLDAARLADGRYLVRTFKADGAGLSLDASGDLGLFGALSFKGAGKLKDLGAVRSGGKGTVQARWSAAQSRAGQPWKLSADLTGVGMAFGQPAADRLLGSRPTAHVDGGFDKGVITLAKAELDGAAGRLGVKGTIAPAGPLKLAADWSADAPLTFGPVGLSGHSHGTAQVGGTLAAPRAQAVLDVERLDLPQLSLAAAHGVFDIARGDDGLGGDFNLTAAGHYGPAHARGGFHLQQDRLAFTGLDVLAGGASAQGALALRQGAPVTADLTLGAGPGAFLDQGRADARLQIVDPGIATLSLTATNLAPHGQPPLLRSLKLTAQGPLAHLPYWADAQADYGDWPMQLDGVGVASQGGGALVLTFSGTGRFRSADFHTLSPATLTLAGAEHDAHLDLSVGGGRAQIQARQGADSIDAQAQLADVDLAALGENLTGRFDAQLSLEGQGARLGGKLDAQLKGARSRDAPSKLALDGAVQAVLDDGRLTLDVDGQGGATKNHANVHAVLPADASAAPFRLALDRQRPISGQVSADGDLQPIWDLFFGGERELGGQLKASGALAGTLAAPRLTGHASVTQGLFEDAPTGLKLRDFAAEADLSEDAVDVQRFSGKDAHNGALSGQGRLGLAPNSPSTLQLTLHDFQLLDNEQARASASGTVTVARDASGHSKLSGVLSIDRADIQAAQSRTPPGVIGMDVIERNKPSEGGAPGIAAPPAAGPALQLDVRLAAPRRIFVRGLGLDAELSLDARVVGDTNAPDLQGRAQVVRGIYNFAGKRFDIDDTGYVDLATTPEAIKLNLSATLNDPALTAIIEIKGTAAKPVITLTSTPVLPGDEVLAQVLFGQSAAQLSPVQAAQLAAAVTSLATGGGFDVMGGLGKFARLDRIALGGTSATGVTVSGGKYIGSLVYLELTGGGRQGPSAEVDVRATKSLSLISQVGGDLGAMIGLRWHMDYGKPTPPKTAPAH